MRIPSPAEIRALHQKYAPTAEAFDLVHSHCETVWSIAEQLIGASRLAPDAVPGGGTGAFAGIDPELVRAGCLLHDIGVYRLYDEHGTLDYPNYLRHGLLGHEILEREGFPEPLRRFCSCHTGVGLTRDDIARQGLPLPPGDYVAVSTEEKLVMYADKFHSKSTPPRFVPPEKYAVQVGRFGADKVAAFEALRATFGDPDLAALGAVPQG
ncbi:HD domain-containing protein [Streptomyces sp. DT24]|uniref:HD domain-containing protein n=1 Tax=Streptomyces sp. DT24 TaxID=3416520 RepID=UPI003CF42DB7